MARPRRHPYPKLIEVLRPALHEFFDTDGRFKAREFSLAAECTVSNVYTGMVGKGSISVQMMRKIIEISGGKLTAEELLRFVKQQ